MVCKKEVATFSTFLFIITAMAPLFPADAWAQNTYKILHTFKGAPNDGSFPQSGVTFDGVGNLYGTNPMGGAHGYGTVFRLRPSTGGFWTETVLHSFNNNGHDGLNSYAGLAFDSKGNLFGTTYYGGLTTCGSGVPSGCGTVFELSPNARGGWIYRVIYSFKAGIDGAWPSSTLILDSKGSLYGTTASGGTGSCTVGDYIGCGTVFKLTPSSRGWTETILHSFIGGADGQFLYGGLVRDAAGNLYGTTANGGSSGCFENLGCGTVFRLSLSGGVWTKTTLHVFAGNDGAAPVGNLVFDNLGNLYGATAEGGANGSGNVFELTPSSGFWNETVLHSFCSFCVDGSSPYAGVIFDGAGNLYGTTRNGGVNNEDGIVFKLTPNTKGGWQENVLHRFYNHPNEPCTSPAKSDNSFSLQKTSWSYNY